MSTDWGFACKQCKDEDGQPIADTWFHNRPEVVRFCYKVWPHVKAIKDLDPDGYIDLDKVAYYYTDVWDFLEKHYEHGLWLANEYGNIWNMDDEPYKDKPVGGYE